MLYTFREGRAGGVAIARIDPASGRIVSQEVLGRSPLFLRPHKIKLSETGRYLLATSQHAGKDNLFLGDLATGQHRFLSVDRTPDDLASWQDHFAVGALNQICYLIDASIGSVSHRWNGQHELRPDGRRIEYVATSSDGVAWTSWQKDNPGGTREGSRVVTIDILSGRTLGDLRMPRALPQLHLPDRKERGPSPEIIIPSTRTNTLLLSMDLYGGIAMADLDAAKDGAWRDLSYHSAALDGGWGTAFPDRAAVYRSGAKDFVFVANAGEGGGVLWIDLADRRIAQTLPSPPGLSAPAIVGGGRYLVSATSGKTKYVKWRELWETRRPEAALHVFEVSGVGGSSPRLSAREVSLPVPAQHVAAIPGSGSDYVLATSNSGSGGPELLVVKASTGAIVDRQPAVGEVARVALP